jgi:hypothetical protein
MSSINLKSYYLDTANQNQLKNYVMNELSHKYNIQPVIGQLNKRFHSITEIISQNVKADNNLNLQQNLERINRITIEQCLNGFSKVLEPFEKIEVEQPVQNSVNNTQDNSDITNLYSKLMTERDYTSNPISTISQPVNNIINSQTPQFILPSIPEEPFMPQVRNNSSSFQERIEMLKQNRNNVLDQRNLIDLETRENNYKQNVLGEQPTQRNFNTDLLNNNTLYNDNFNINNVGQEIVSQSEIKEHRFAEFKDEKSMDYKKIDRQFFLCSKDRQWYGDISNNNLQPALEPFRYRIHLNNNNQKGIFLQNRQKNISSIRIVAVYLSISDINTYMPPYIFVYIPELENRVETSIINRKYVFSILTKDDVIGTQTKYINFLTDNEYDPTPLSEINNLTFEILNPLGTLYNDSKDDLLISEIGLDDLFNPKNLVITTNKVYKTNMYNVKDVLLIQNFGFKDGSNGGLKNYLNRDEGHTITTPTELLRDNNFYNKIYIELPVRVLDDGQIMLEPIIIEFQAYLTKNGNPATNVYGAFINLILQPSIIMEISKLEPNSKEINQSRVTLI